MSPLRLLPVFCLLSQSFSGRLTAEDPGKTPGSAAPPAFSAGAAIPPETEKKIIPLPNAHAHNDYGHQRPLLDALDCGFMNVEVDIHLVDGALLVAHDRKDVKPDRTLRALYLQPLADFAARGGGRVYPGAEPVTLLIDFKSAATETWTALEPVLEEFKDILTEFSGGKVTRRAVTVILSGSSPDNQLAGASRRLAFLDGRPDDLEQNPPASLVPWVSSSWTGMFAWRGVGTFPDDQNQRLRHFTAKAHAQGRKVRFWGVHDTPFAWDILRAGGADVLGSDNLTGLRDYLLGMESGQGTESGKGKR